MLPIVHAILRTDKKNSKGLSPIYIQTYLKGKRTQRTTKLFIDPKHWKDGKVTGPDAQSLNIKIRKIIAELETVYNDRAVHGVVEIQENPEAFMTFVEYAKLFYKKQAGKLDPTTLEKYASKLKQIGEWDNKTKITGVKYAWLENLEHHLRSTGRSGNTVWDYFKVVRAVILNAKSKGILKVNPLDDYPFPEYVDPVKEYLTKVELEKIEQFINENEKSTTTIIALFFLLECYSALRHSDWSRFKIERLNDGEAIKVNTKKTGEPVYLYIESSPKLKWVVDKIREWDIQYSYSLETANRELKSIARECKINKRLSSHVGRHSFGVMCAELGISIETTAACMAISTKITSTYYKVTRQKVKNEFKAWERF